MKVLGPVSRTKGGNFTIIVHEEWKWSSYHPESIWQIDLQVPIHTNLGNNSWCSSEMACYNKNFNYGQGFMNVYSQ